MNAKQRSLPRILLVVAKMIVAVAGAALLLGVVAVVLFMVPTVRERIASYALERAKKAIPGAVSVGRVSWPSPGSITLDSVLWTAQGDTLLQASRVGLAMDLQALVRRDVHVEAARLEELRVDVPAIQSRMPSDVTDGSEEGAQRSRSGFPRSGALPGVPSVAVDEAVVTAPMIKLGKNNTITNVILNGGCELRRDRSAAIRIRKLALEGPTNTWRVEELSLDVDPEHGRIEGTGRGRVHPDWPVSLSITSSAPDSFRVVIAESDSTLPPRSPGVVILGKLERRNLDIRAIGFDAWLRTPSTSDLGSKPALASTASQLPKLDGLTLNARGRLALKPQTAIDVAIDMQENDWLEEGRLAAVYGNGDVEVRDLSLRMTDLAITGDAALRADSVAVHLSLRVAGNQSLGLLRPEMTLPDDLSADVAIVAAGETRDRYGVSIEANGQAYGIVVDRLVANGVLSDRPDTPSSVTLIVQAMDRYLGLATRIDRDKDIVARLAPIEIQSSPIKREELERRDLNGGILYSLATRHLAIDNLTLTGSEGNLRVDARLDSALAGTFAIDADWPRPPELLLRALGAESEMADSLRKSWSDATPFRLAVRGDISGSGRLRTEGSFTLPGPHTLALAVPALQSIDELGPVKGEFSFTSIAEDEWNRMSVIATLDSTDWIDSSSVRIHTTKDGVAVDTVALAALGLAVTASGTMSAGVLDVNAGLDCDSTFVPLVVDGAPMITLQTAVHLFGTKQRPAIDASLEGSVKGGDIGVPRVVGNLQYGAQGTSLTIDLPAGLITPAVSLDSVSLDAQSVGDEGRSLPVQLTLSAVGKDLRFFQSARIDTTGGLIISGEKFLLDVGGRDLASTQPFRLQRSADGIVVDGLSLAGSLGEIRANGSLGKTTTDLDCDVTVQFAQKPPSLNVPDHMWPERLDAHLKAHNHDITADALLKGFSLAHRLRSTLSLKVEARADSVAAHVSIADNERSLLDATASMPATVSAYPPAVKLNEGPLAVDVSIDQFPLAFYFLRGGAEIPKEQVARLTGKIVLRGDSHSPIGSATAALSFPDWPKLAAYQLEIESRLGVGQTPAEARLLRDAEKEITIASENNLLAAVSLNTGGRRVLFGALAHPLTLGLQPFSVVTPTDGTVHAVLRSQAVSLEDFDPLLPADIILKGSCSIDLSADGPVDNPRLSGTIVPKQFEVAVAEQARVTAEGKVEISGTRQAPQVKGNIRIPRGLIRVPEDIQQLHPVQGDARLLDSRSPARTAPESADSDTTSTEEERAESQSGDFDVTITIPSGFWIRGKGLDLELAGDLNIRKQRAKPTVTGELRVIVGTFVFLGRSFKLDRGTVNFYGQDEINPALDVVLSTRVSQTDIRILVGGTAHKPQIILTSDPEMREGDIISMLLFGTTFDDLSDNQADFVQQRTTDMVAALGAAELQKSVSGIDVVSYKGSDNQNESGTLTFGKYLNPDVLLSYVYAIDDQAGSFVSLEYFLKGNFRVDTVYGRRNQTGLGFGWLKDY